MDACTHRLIPERTSRRLHMQRWGGIVAILLALLPTTLSPGAADGGLSVVNVGLDGVGILFDNGRVVFRVSEDRQGETDLNGDGDTSDFVPHLFNVRTGVITNVGLAAILGSLDRNWATLVVREENQAATDLNGDGDTDDRVLHVFNLATGAITNVGLAVQSFQLDKGRVAFTVPESNQAATDLNGDGDTDDRVLHLFNAKTGAVTNLGFDISRVFIDNKWIVFEVREANQAATDLNGDDDAFDRVLHLLNLKTGVIANVGLDVSSIRQDKKRVAFCVREANQGAADLNGDGDAADCVLHVFNKATGVITNVGLDVIGGIRIDNKWIAFEVREANQAATDLNGDGDATDRVIHVLAMP